MFYLEDFPCENNIFALYFRYRQQIIILIHFTVSNCRESEEIVDHNFFFPSSSSKGKRNIKIERKIRMLK